MHRRLRDLFAGLPLGERLFIRARWSSAPLAEISRRVIGTRILDIGCGHGLLCAMMALDRADRRVTGIDPDRRKIDRARRSAGHLPNTRFEVATADRLAAVAPGGFDSVTVADVLYLLPREDWPAFLGACFTLLRPGGVLLLKEAEDDGGWRARKALFQEQLMVRIFGRTLGSGGLGFAPRAQMKALLQAAGFSVTEVVPLSRGYTTPHVLYVAERAPGSGPADDEVLRAERQPG